MTLKYRRILRGAVGPEACGALYLDDKHLCCVLEGAGVLEAGPQVLPLPPGTLELCWHVILPTGEEHYRAAIPADGIRSPEGSPASLFASLLASGSLLVEDAP